MCVLNNDNMLVLFKMYLGLVLELPEFNRSIRPQVARKWYDLGIQLSLNVHKLNNIKANNPGDIEQCCTQMYQHWLNSDHQASREKLAVALQHIEYHTLAESVRNISMEGNDVIICRALKCYMSRLSYIIREFMNNGL